MSAPEAFILLTLPNATLTAFDTTESGPASLVCVTVQHPEHAHGERDVYLMLRINETETPIDPAGKIQRTDVPGSRTYTFHRTDVYPADRVLKLSIPYSKEFTSIMEDLETFDSLLAQYADLQGVPAHHNASYSSPAPMGDKAGARSSYGDDLRGHLVAINEDTGEVIGQFDDRQLRVREDPKMHEKGHENDAVFIELPDTRSGAAQDATALEMFISAVPPDQQDWITKSATIVSHAISQTTNLLLTTITAASSYYISNSTPSPHHPSQARANGAPSGSNPPPLPPRALVFLTSEQTRKGLANVHAVSGQAVKVSSKTVSYIDNMIRRAMGGKPKQPRRFLPADSSSALAPNAAGPSLLPRTPSPLGSKGQSAAPPPYSGPSAPTTYLGDKPALPARRSTSPAPPLPPRTYSGAPGDVMPAGPAAPLRKRERVLLSLDLVFSTLDHETRRFFDEGTHTVGAVVGHKYGPDAAHASMLMAGTAKNVGLVYVDMRGIGRRALLKRAGAEYVKTRLRSQ